LYGLRVQSRASIPPRAGFQHAQNSYNQQESGQSRQISSTLLCSQMNRGTIPIETLHVAKDLQACIVLTEDDADVLLRAKLAASKRSKRAPQERRRLLAIVN
jgi:hypothetical protein